MIVTARSHATKQFLCIRHFCSMNRDSFALWARNDIFIICQHKERSDELIFIYPQKRTPVPVDFIKNLARSSVRIKPAAIEMARRMEDHCIILLASSAV